MFQEIKMGCSLMLKKHRPDQSERTIAKAEFDKNYLFMAVLLES
jgi:hypothetical protein